MTNLNTYKIEAEVTVLSESEEIARKAIADFLNDKATGDTRITSLNEIKCKELLSGKKEKEEGGGSADSAEGQNLKQKVTGKEPQRKMEAAKSKGK